MSDEADSGNDTAEKFDKMFQSLRMPEGPRPTGSCLECGELTHKRWCDADCRDAWQKRQRRNA